MTWVNEWMNKSTQQLYQTNNQTYTYTQTNAILPIRWNKSTHTNIDWYGLEKYRWKTQQMNVLENRKMNEWKNVIETMFGNQYKVIFSFSIKNY